ncbi:unnamed protein product [Urochloa humidicola]
MMKTRLPSARHRSPSPRDSLAADSRFLPPDLGAQGPRPISLVAFLFQTPVFLASSLACSPLGCAGADSRWRSAEEWRA